MGGLNSQGRLEASPLRSLPESAGNAPSAREDDGSRYKHQHQARAYPASTLAIDQPAARGSIRRKPVRSAHCTAGSQGRQPSDAVDRLSSLDYVSRLQAFRSLYDVKLYLLPFT